MWIIQNQGLLRLPDDVPLPPNSKKVQLHGEFEQQPHLYRLKGNTVVKLGAKELKRHEAPRETLKLTLGEIAQLRKALAAGKL
jgi:hypothetical protein